MLKLSNEGSSVRSGVWGIKIGMTQLFEGDRVVPVTAIDVSPWVVTNVKTVDRDQYEAVQLGLPRDRYKGMMPTIQWFKKLKDYFRFVREVRSEGVGKGIKSGDHWDSLSIIAEGDVVDIQGKTRGRGFTGGVKRHGFSGGKASHGSAMGERRPGSIGWMRRQGRVEKGKRMAGHMGVEVCMMRNLRIVKVEKDAQVLFVKGAVPGHSGSLVFIKKR